MKKLIVLGIALAIIGALAGCGKKREASSDKGSGNSSESIRMGKKTGDTMVITLPGGAEMEMIYVAPGSFMMGSEDGEDDEKPVRKVTLTKGFWLGKYEVTQAQWQSVMGENPSYFIGDAKPVENVSWNDCQKFISKVNAKLGDDVARLPTEAEWEYACRAGTTGDYGGTGKLDEMGWFADNSAGKTHPVGQKKANGWGFHDMHGNVCEWNSDSYGGYSTEECVDPTGPFSGAYQVGRGGGWSGNARDCTSSGRDIGCPSDVYCFTGFRLACSMKPRGISEEDIQVKSSEDDTENSRRQIVRRFCTVFRLCDHDFLLKVSRDMKDEIGECMDLLMGMSRRWGPVKTTVIRSYKDEEVDFSIIEAVCECDPLYFLVGNRKGEQRDKDDRIIAATTNEEDVKNMIKRMEEMEGRVGRKKARGDDAKEGAYSDYRTQSEKAVCIENMKVLRMAGEQCMLAGTLAPTLDDLCGETKYIRRTPTCLSGGMYKVRARDGYGLEVTCSEHGSLEENLKAEESTLPKAEKMALPPAKKSVPYDEAKKWLPDDEAKAKAEPEKVERVNDAAIKAVPKRY